MLESGSSGSVRGASSNGRPYREHFEMFRHVVISKISKYGIGGASGKFRAKQESNGPFRFS